MRHYYVYYRIDPEHTEAARAAVRHIFTTIQKCANVTGRILKKPDEPNLWMEIYENVTATAVFESALREAETQTGILRYLADEGRRHMECFENLE